LTAANLITDHSATSYRVIGWFKRTAGAIVAFHTYEIEGGGIEMKWDTPSLEVSVANTLTTARRTDALKVPLNFSVMAHVSAGITDGSSIGARICCPDETDAAPTLSTAPLCNLVQQVAGTLSPMELKVRTSAAGLIAARASSSTMDLYVVQTDGFTWGRRN
jgi:hypothetical protein